MLNNITMRVVLIAGFLSTFLGGYSDAVASEGLKIPEQIVARSNAYVIDKVGKEYFEKNYQLRLDKSGPFGGNVDLTRPFNYLLVYEYLPLSHLVGEEVFVEVMIHSSLQFPASGHVACLKDGQILEPQISRQRALEIAGQHGLEVEKDGINLYSKSPDETFFKFYTGPGSPLRIQCWYWRLEIPVTEGPPCWYYHAGLVDASNGDFYDVGQGGACE